MLAGLLLWGCAGSSKGYPQPLHNMSVYEMFPGDLKAQALALAAAEGDIKRIDKLVAQGGDVNARGTYGVTVPTWVLYHPNRAGFRRLLELGADPNMHWDDGGSLLHWSAFLAYAIGPDYLQMALEVGRGNPNLEDLKTGKRPIEHVLDNNEAFAVLYNAGAEIDFTTPGGVPIVVNTLNNYDLILFMLHEGVDVWHKFPNGSNCLQQKIQWDMDDRLWLINGMSFWRCVDFLEKQGMTFIIPPDVKRPEVLDTTPPSILELIKRR